MQDVNLGEVLQSENEKVSQEGDSTYGKYMETH